MSRLESLGLTRTVPGPKSPDAPRRLADMQGVPGGLPGTFYAALRAIRAEGGVGEGRLNELIASVGDDRAADLVRSFNRATQALNTYHRDGRGPWDAAMNDFDQAINRSGSGPDVRQLRNIYRELRNLHTDAGRGREPAVGGMTAVSRDAFVSGNSDVPEATRKGVLIFRKMLDDFARTTDPQRAAQRWTYLKEMILKGDVPRLIPRLPRDATEALAGTAYDIARIKGLHDGPPPPRNRDAALSDQYSRSLGLAQFFREVTNTARRPQQGLGPDFVTALGSVTREARTTYARPGVNERTIQNAAQGVRQRYGSAAGDAVTTLLTSAARLSDLAKFQSTGTTNPLHQAEREKYLAASKQLSRYLSPTERQLVQRVAGDVTSRRQRTQEAVELRRNQRIAAEPTLDARFAELARSLSDTDFVQKPGQTSQRGQIDALVKSERFRQLSPEVQQNVRVATEAAFSALDSLGGPRGNDDALELIGRARTSLASLEGSVGRKGGLTRASFDSLSGLARRLDDLANRRVGTQLNDEVVNPTSLSDTEAMRRQLTPAAQQRALVELNEGALVQLRNSIDSLYRFADQSGSDPGLKQGLKGLRDLMKAAETGSTVDGLKATLQATVAGKALQASLAELYNGLERARDRGVRFPPEQVKNLQIMSDNLDHVAKGILLPVNISAATERVYAALWGTNFSGQQVAWSDRARGILEVPKLITDIETGVQTGNASAQRLRTMATRIAAKAPGATELAASLARLRAVIGERAAAAVERLATQLGETRGGELVSRLVTAVESNPRVAGILASLGPAELVALARRVMPYANIGLAIITYYEGMYEIAKQAKEAGKSVTDLQLQDAFGGRWPHALLRQLGELDGRVQQGTGDDARMVVQFMTKGWLKPRPGFDYTTWTGGRVDGDARWNNFLEGQMSGPDAFGNERLFARAMRGERLADEEWKLVARSVIDAGKRFVNQARETGRVPGQPR